MYLTIYTKFQCQVPMQEVDKMLECGGQDGRIQYCTCLHIVKIEKLKNVGTGCTINDVKNLLLMQYQCSGNSCLLFFLLKNNTMTAIKGKRTAKQSACVHMQGI